MKLYTKMHLLEALKEAGLPSTYKSLLKLEKDGVVPKSESGTDFSVNRMRLYTGDEIKTIVSLVKTHKKNG
jgi:hypothetical protein